MANEKGSESPPDVLVYSLDARPAFLESCLVGFQHVLAVFVGIVTPPLIISGALGLDIRDTSYIVSMSLLISGVATFIQTRRVGPVGSGLLSVQGTSFAFLAPIIGAAAAVTAAGGTTDDRLLLRRVPTAHLDGADLIGSAHTGRRAKE